MDEPEEKMAEDTRITLLVELVLYEQVRATCEPYLKEDMSEAYKREICVKAGTFAIESILRFCKEYNVEPVDVIKKLKACLPKNIDEQVCSEQYRVVEQMLGNIETGLQKQGKDMEGR